MTRWKTCVTSNAQALAKGNNQPTDAIVAATMERCREQEDVTDKALKEMKAWENMLAEPPNLIEPTDLTMAILRDDQTKQAEAVVDSNR